MRNASTPSSRLINFLGSMNLAISLLVVLAIASIIGTVLQQNKPYTDYQIKFGSFWFDLFKTLGLYDVYSAVWFLTILGFLVLSTTTCVGRNTPRILRELRHFRENIQEKSLRAMKHQMTLTSTAADNATALSIAQRILTAQGFKTRTKQADDHTVIAGMRGGSNHWGYWLTHLGIIVICLGGLMDSRLPLMIAEWQGNLKPETRNIPAADVPPISQLPPSSYSYRGSVDIPEGNRANIIFLPVRDGYLVQHLPFEVEVKDFRVEHYSTGMPKSFESDLVIHDKALDKPLESTISVNHPLIYKGVAIYQANFGDGGSQVNLHLHPFSTRYAAQDMQGNVFRDYNLSSSDKKYKLEINDFRLFNINDIEEDGKAKKKNIGPSVTFKLRDETGQAMEYQNYMNPVTIKGQHYFISGVRTTPNEPFRYLHIPVDPKGGMERFMRFLSDMQNPELVKKSAMATTQLSMKQANMQNTGVETQVIESMVQLTSIFASKGSDGIMEEITKRFPQDRQEAASEAFMKVLNAALRAVYQDSLKQAGVTGELTEADWSFFDDSLLAIDKIAAYGSPWLVQMTSFKQVEASGLQITRSPGKDVVYFGSAMLTLGVFLLFYVAHRRIWVWVKPNGDNRVELVLAGSSNRNLPEFERYFNKLQGIFRQTLVREVTDDSSTGKH